MPSPCSTPLSQPRRAAFTLVEMLVGMAITLVMMAAVVTLFANVSSSVRNRRANAELGAQLRHARSRLAQDLAGATAPGRTWLRPEGAVGYLEIIDGPWSDQYASPLIQNNELDYATSIIPSSNLPLAIGAVTDAGGLGDFDGILALTVKSQGEPFRGRIVDPSTGRVETIESEYAEVIWYAIENPADGSLGEPGLRTLYRRVLLIAPWLPPAKLPDLASLPGANDDQRILYFYQNYDVSVRFYRPEQLAVDADITLQTNVRPTPNTLADLTKRENRFAHRLSLNGTPYGWPFLIDQRAIRYLPGSTLADVTSPLQPFGWGPSNAPTDRLGEDVMLNDVLAFDLRVYDPGAPLVVWNPPTGDVLEPTDPGWDVMAPADVVGFGAYVNLGWDPSVSLSAGPWAGYSTRYLPADVPSNAPVPLFKEPHQPGWHPLINPADPAYGYGFPAVYDTWSFHYEHDGLNQDHDRGNFVNDIVDQGTNGLDDRQVPGDPNSAVNGVDDIGEYETSPPYDTPLRGLKVIVRAYERDARQIRETSVTHTFVP